MPYKQSIPNSKRETSGGGPSPRDQLYVDPVAGSKTRDQISAEPSDHRQTSDESPGVESAARALDGDVDPIRAQQLNNPLHGVKLLEILEFLVARYGWEALGERISIRCFTSYPSIQSSLKFLRKTPWARERVENLYLQSIPFRPRQRSSGRDGSQSD